MQMVVTNPKLQRFGDQVKITRLLIPLHSFNCSVTGNVILSLNDTNAAQQMLSSLSKVVEQSQLKEERALYLQLKYQQINEENLEKPHNGRSDLDITKENTISHVYRIISGDPSKGTLAIECVNDIPTGIEAQFLVHCDSPLHSLSELSKEIDSTVKTELEHASKSSTMIVNVIDESDSQLDYHGPKETENSPDSSPTVKLSLGIECATENGFIFKESYDKPTDSWLCEIPHSKLLIKA